MLTDQIQLGKRIRDIRTKAKMTQSDLHEKTGISTTQLSAYENGKKSIGLQTIAKIAKALNVTIDDIYYGSPESRPIYSASNEGELIVNCIYALYILGVVCNNYHEKYNEYVSSGYEGFYKIGFCNHVHILDDLIKRLDDFEVNKNSYPDPSGFKNQLLASAIKRINETKK